MPPSTTDWTDYRIPVDDAPEAGPRRFEHVGKWRLLVGGSLLGLGWLATSGRLPLSGEWAGLAWYAGVSLAVAGAVVVLGFLLLNHRDADVEALPTLRN